MLEPAEMVGRLRAVLEEVARFPGARLVAVSKKQPPGAVRILYEAGQRDFGENYLQEWQGKKGGLPADLRWHFIGQVQSRKVPVLAREGACAIHGFGSLSSLERLNALEAWPEGGCLLQVNLEAEPQKGGASPAELEDWAGRGLLGRISGLMSIPPAGFDGVRLARHFREVRTLAERYHLRELSMGMSGDWRIALAEGATILRLGTAIFGERTHV